MKIKLSIILSILLLISTNIKSPVIGSANNPKDIIINADNYSVSADA
ncbi:MAG: hypothetical protein PUG67_02125 [Peptoniphilaceae bacterium]|nr:hypothetical protein [Peptoniphilaceae bacterium]MDY6018846.1 hypothetical protein [Anaerococcus sp.]